MSQRLQWAPQLPLLSKQTRKTIFIQVQNDPNNAAEWIFILHEILPNDFALFVFVLVCVCVLRAYAYKGNTDAHMHATRLVSESSRRRERYNDTKRRVSILVLPRAGEINGCIQDFYTRLIGFTGH